MILGVSAPEIEGAAIPVMAALALISFVAFIVLLGMRVTCVDWVTALLRWFAKHTPSLPFVGNLVGDLTDAVASGIENTVGAALSYAAAAFEQSTVFWFDGCTAVVKYLADSLAWDLTQVEHGFRVMVDSYIPWAVRQGRAEVFKGIDELNSQAKHIVREAEAQLARGIDTTLKESQKASEAAGRAGAAGAAAGLAAARPLYNPLEHALQEQGKYLHDVIEARLRAVEKEAAVGAAAYALARTIAHEFPYFQCTNVKSVGKALCNFPVKALEGLLGLLAGALTFSAICEVLPVLEKGLEITEPFITSFTSGAAAVLCKGNYTATKPLAVPALQLPSESTQIPTLQLP